MEAAKLLSASLADILFEGRNKSYGAYELRKNYDKRMYTALFIGCSFMLILFGVIVNAQHSKITEIVPDVVLGTHPYIIVEPPKMPTKPTLNGSTNTGKKSSQKQKGKSIVFVDEDVVLDTTFSTISSSSGLENTDEVSNTENGMVGGASEAQGGGDRNEVLPDSSQVIYNSVDEHAYFPGGLNAWSKYLIRKLDKDKPVEQGADPGTYTVFVNFVVNTDGSIEQVKANTAHGFQMEEEAVRVVRSGPKWKPAKKNGKAVRTYCRQPITFIVQE